MNRRDLNRATAKTQRAISNMLSRGQVDSYLAAASLPIVQAKLLADEDKAGLEYIESYGFSHSPHPGAELVAAFFDGDRSHGSILKIGDRRYRVAQAGGMAEGEVMVWDDLGHKIYLTRAGIVIDGGGHKITLTNTPEVRMETLALNVTGNIRDNCDSQVRTMSAMRSIYDSHTHNETNTVTLTPNQHMIP